MRFLLLTSVFFLGLTGSISGQPDMPVNTNYSSETEYLLLKQAYLGGLTDPFILHAAANSSLDIAAIQAKKDELEEFIAGQAERYDRQDHEKQMIRNVFYKVHRKYLKQYRNHSNLGELLESGDYDCLSGTILYAWLLERLGYPSQIVETSHHIYLLVHTNSGDVMLESTDALNGFIDRSEEIEVRLQTVLAEEESNFSGQVDFIELIGLQYYNAAVEAYNGMELIEAVDQMEKASLFYKGDRMKKFGTILARAIVQSGMEQQVKTSYLMKLTNVLNTGQTVARLN